MRAVASALALSALGLAHALLAQTTDIIRGRVTGPDTASIPGVAVRATSFFGGVAKTATTDGNGRFTIIVLNGEGDYWLDVNKISR